MRPAEFDRLVNVAIAALPGNVRNRLETVVVEVRPRPTTAQLAEQGMGDGEELLGLFDGVSDLDRGLDDTGTLPSRIYLFQEPLEDEAAELLAERGGAFEDHLREEIRRTLWHELAHGLGFDDEELHQLEEKRGWR